MKVHLREVEANQAMVASLRIRELGQSLSVGPLEEISFPAQPGRELRHAELHVTKITGKGVHLKAVLTKASPADWRLTETLTHEFLLPYGEERQFTLAPRLSLETAYGHPGRRMSQ